jgi:hypothetical protein
MDRICPDHDFLSTLFVEHWGKQPGVFKQALIGVATDQELLDSISSAAQEAARGDGEVSFYSFAKDREVRGEETLQFVPHSASLQEYFTALHNALGGDNFGLMINGYEKVCPAAWKRLADVREYMVDHIGIPVGSVHCSLLLGNYSGTNFGIRRDPVTGVVSLGLMGRKRMLVWPEEYFQERSVKRMKLGASPIATEMILAEPDAFVADAVELEFDAGDVAYWPEGWWHLAHQKEEGQVWVTLSIGVQVGVPLSATVATWVRTLLRKRFGEDDIYFPEGGLDPKIVPPPIQTAAGTLRALVQSGEVRRWVQESWRQQCQHTVSCMTSGDE